jgi:hypothetical protein
MPKPFGSLQFAALHGVVYTEVLDQKRLGRHVWIQRPESSFTFSEWIPHNITFRFSPFRFGSLTLKAISRLAWLRRRVAPTPKKRVFANPTRRVKDRVQRQIRTYLGIKMTPAGRADALAGVISPEPITAVSRKNGEGKLHCLTL